MSNQKADIDLQTALVLSGLVQPVSSKVKGGKLQIMCRLQSGADKRWLEVVESLLKLTKEAPAEIIICRRYILKDEHMVFGWFLHIDAKNVKSLEMIVSDMVGVIGSYRPLLEAPVIQAPRRALAPGEHPPVRLPPPRPPGEPGMDHQPPEGFVPKLTTVKNITDANGRPTVIEEMPLPHVHKEMNQINSKGRGAKSI